MRDLLEELLELAGGQEEELDVTVQLLEQVRIAAGSWGADEQEEDAAQRQGQRSEPGGMRRETGMSDFDKGEDREETQNREKLTSGSDTVIKTEASLEEDAQNKLLMEVFAVQQSYTALQAGAQQESELSFGRERKAFLRELQEFWRAGPEQTQEPEGKTGQSAVLAQRVSRQGRWARSARRAAARVQETPTVTAARPSQTTAASAGAREVDRVFQRDARRYDCGFTLF